jgi:TonB family protein
MFTQLNAARRPTNALYVSVVLHALVAFWLLHEPPPIFVAPSSIVHGANGSTVTPLYWSTSAQASTAASKPPAHAREKLVWNEPSKSAKEMRFLAKASESAADAISDHNKPAPAAGSPYGSASDGALLGSEVRPALWASGYDPVIGPADLAGVSEGNEVVEITIDDQGNVVHTAVLQSLGPEVDAKVVAALEHWHFHPATRDGLPIPSRQDVYYHYPRR